MKNRRMRLMVNYIREALNELNNLIEDEVMTTTQYVRSLIDDEVECDPDLIWDDSEMRQRWLAIDVYNRGINRGISEEILEAWFDRAGYMV